MAKKLKRYDAGWTIRNAMGKLINGSSSEDFTSKESADEWARKACQTHLKPGQLGRIWVIKTPPGQSVVNREIRYASSEH